jgi:hypothetical protein
MMMVNKYCIESFCKFLIFIDVHELHEYSTSLIHKNDEKASKQQKTKESKIIELSKKVCGYILLGAVG